MGLTSHENLVRPRVRSRCQRIVRGASVFCNCLDKTIPHGMAMRCGMGHETPHGMAIRAESGGRR